MNKQGMLAVLKFWALILGISLLVLGAMLLTTKPMFVIGGVILLTAAVYASYDIYQMNKGE